MADQPRNRLADATSPYLLQHAHNPVAWYEWGDDAFADARANDKPVLLSVGYSACHWCHVMAHESFEDEATAAIMNEHFVNIKVDREERPDIDSVYMTAVQAMTGSGGWPMTVFLTPDGTPFYGGTYFPPQDRYGMPSFTRLLLSVAEAYHSRRSELQQAGNELVGRMREAGQASLGEQALTLALLDDAYAVLEGQFDPTYGGFGGAPKFPQAMTLEFLLRYAARTGRPEALDMVERTLRGMAEGGMYDQIGGGFHRYSVDAQWLVPHFEKMLYDNALLARTYLEAYQLTGAAFYRRIVEETLDYLVREMRHPDGGFYSTQDADSLPYAGADHKHEGAYFVWTPAELRAVLGPDAMPFAQIYDVTDAGNFEGKNILHAHRSPDEVARVLGMTQPQIADLIVRSRDKLHAARAKRPAPDTDTKILAAWNGMAIRAFAAAGRALGRDDYLAVAVDAASFVLRELRRTDGTLLRAWKDGVAGTTPGFLEDHALVADGLLALYEATFDSQWLLAARTLADTIVAGFWDDTIGGFYDTAAHHQSLVVRPRDTGDNATPSGSSVAADVLARLALLFDEGAYRARVEQVLAGMAPFMQRYPSGFGRYLSVAEFVLGAPFEIVLVGTPGAPDTQALAAPVFARFVPNKVVALKQPGHPDPFESPLLHEREQVGGRATAYVCQNYTCRLPVTEPNALLAQLGIPAS